MPSGSEANSLLLIHNRRGLVRPSNRSSGNEVNSFPGKFNSLRFVNPAKSPRLERADFAVREIQNLYGGQVLVRNVFAIRAGEAFENPVANLRRAIADASRGRRIGC